MKSEIKISYFSPVQKGVIVEADSVSISTGQVGCEDSGVIIYDDKDNEYRFPFSKEGRRGSLYGMKIHMGVTKQHSYLLYKGDETTVDREAKLLLGNTEWGADSSKTVRGGFYFNDFDWEDDKAPDTAYSDSIIYGLNVRAFTMHKSSAVKNKGTFAGIIEKIDYLRKLGITAVELQPAYNFDEFETVIEKSSGNNVVRLNCWGYKDSYYYAPKSAFAGSLCADIAFKEMVKALHQSGIEVIMHFYFPTEFNRSDILDILRYWVIEYHLDGIHLIGTDIPYNIITGDYILSGTKIIYHEYSYRETEPRFKNTAIFRDQFMIEIRRLLKGDDDMTNALLYHHRHLLSNCGTINYLADYTGFSLFDMTAYDKKRNEPNGEENLDGTNYNYSWNCGYEGPSRKKSITALRLKQLKNALSLLFLSQGTPFIYSGDEFGNTRHGNNNSYCQDNNTGWVKWTNNNISREILAFTKELTAFRKKHPILHLPSEFRILDWQRCGYPDISYHGKEAWRPDLNPYSRTVGIMLCGKYAGKGLNGDDFICIMVNMHWQKRVLALPNLPKELKWDLVYSTDINEPEIKAEENLESIMMAERSICVFISCAVNPNCPLEQ